MQILVIKLFFHHITTNGHHPRQSLNEYEYLFTWSAFVYLDMVLLKASKWKFNQQSWVFLMQTLHAKTLGQLRFIFILRLFKIHSIYCVNCWGSMWGHCYANTINQHILYMPKCQRSILKKSGKTNMNKVFMGFLVTEDNWQGNNSSVNIIWFFSPQSYSKL